MKLLSSRNHFAFFLIAALFTVPRGSFADTVSFTSSAVSSTTLGPSSDSISLNAGSGTFDPAAGIFTFQTGDFVVGNSLIPDQDVPFKLQDTVTMNGVTQTLTLFGDDNVTETVDTLTFAATLPVYFGGELLTLQSFSLSETAFDDFPVTLSASVTPTPEPGALLLLGTGALFAAIFGIKRVPSAAKV